MISLRDAFMLQGNGVISLVGAGGKTGLMYRLARELADRGETVLTTTTTKILKPSADQSPHVLLARSAAGIVDRAKPLLEKSRHITAAFAENPAGKLQGMAADVIDRLDRAGIFRWIIVEADGASRMPLKAPAGHEPVIPACTRRLIAVVGLDAVGKPLAAPYVFRPEIYADLTGLAPGAPVTEASVARVLTHARGIMKGAPPGALRLVFLNKADDASRVGIGEAIAERLRHQGAGGPVRVVIGTLRGAVPVAACRDLS